jgi:FkbM family methyltransferase
MSYSQHNEEEVICRYFASEKPAVWADLGAWSGKALSNTYRLAELGWSGLAVEPSPSAFAELMKNHAMHPRVTCVNVALMPEAGWQTFHDCGGDAVSTMSDAHRAVWQSAVKFQPMHLWAVTPSQLFARFPGPYRFVSLDTEGLNLPILERLPLLDLGCDLLCVEHENKADRVREIAHAAGLTDELLYNGENIILGRTWA